MHSLAVLDWELNGPTTMEKGGNVVDQQDPSQEGRYKLRLWTRIIIH